VDQRVRFVSPSLFVTGAQHRDLRNLMHSAAAYRESSHSTVGR
jgi:hypothetical protein